MPTQLYGRPRGFQNNGASGWVGAPARCLCLRYLFSRASRLAPIGTSRRPCGIVRPECAGRPLHDQYRRVVDGQSKLSGHLAYRRAFARQPHGILKIFAEGRFARQLRHLLDSYPTLGTAHPVQLDDHRGLILSPRQVAHFALIRVMCFGKLPSASRTNQFAVPTLPPHP
jgi:hypothetical protein